MVTEARQYSPVENRSPYEQFKVGEMLHYTLYQPGQSPASALNQEAIIEDIKGGGFFGRVLMLDKHYVLKTSVPDAWHDFWRRVNWDFRDFPSQVSENQAQLDYLASNLIADTLPVVTEGKFKAPHSYGYTKLGNGYAQAVIRMYGRPPRYDTNEDELSQFKQAQLELTEVALNLGLEQAAQVHPDNPFGMANLWKGKFGEWIWLDTLPAITHKGWVWPFFNFRFHQDVRDFFYPPELPQQVTFNRIHPGRFLDTIRKYEPMFTKPVYRRVQENRDLYNQSYLISKQQQTPVNKEGTALALAESGISFASDLKNKIPRAITTSIEAIKDPNTLALAGVKKAHKAGIIDEKELEQSRSSVSSDIPAARSLALFYEGYGWLISKPMEWGTYAFLALDQEAASLPLAYAGFKSFNGLVRRSGTYLLGKAHGVETKNARKLSMLPYAGDYLGVVSQIRNGAKNNSGIWHYTIRNLIAHASAIFPDGGWGSEREGRWFNKFGKKLEALGK